MCDTGERSETELLEMPMHDRVNRSGTNLFLADLPFFCTESQLYDLLTQAGSYVNSIRIRRGKTGDNLQYGFADVDIASALATVDKLNGQKFMGRRLKMKINEEHVKNPSSSPPKKDSYVQLHVSFIVDYRLSPEEGGREITGRIDEEFLGSIFSAYGEVADIAIKEWSHGYIHQSGYCFVYYENLEAAQQARKELKGRSVQGVLLDVSTEDEKNQRERHNSRSAQSHTQVQAQRSPRHSDDGRSSSRSPRFQQQKQHFTQLQFAPSSLLPVSGSSLPDYSWQQQSMYYPDGTVAVKNSHHPQQYDAMSTVQYVYHYQQQQQQQVVSSNYFQQQSNLMMPPPSPSPSSSSYEEQQQQRYSPLPPQPSVGGVLVPPLWLSPGPPARVLVDLNISPIDAISTVHVAGHPPPPSPQHASYHHHMQQIDMPYYAPSTVPGMAMMMIQAGGQSPLPPLSYMPMMFNHHQQQQGHTRSNGNGSGGCYHSAATSPRSQQQQQRSPRHRYDSSQAADAQAGDNSGRSNRMQQGYHRHQRAVVATAAAAATTARIAEETTMSSSTSLPPLPPPPANPGDNNTEK